MEWDQSVRLWWLFLSIVSLINIFLWFRVRKSLTGPSPWLWCSALYVFGCAFRSFLPRADVQRFVIFDTFLSSVFVGRSVATIAELGFVAQWALILYLLGKKAGERSVVIISFIIFPLIFIAENFSWYAVLTTNYLGSVVEESLWGITFTLITIAVFLLRKHFSGKQRQIALMAIVGLFVYVVYMFAVDVPMYYARWVEDRQNGLSYVSLGDGLHDVLNRWRVSRAHSEWKYEMLWMSLYFSLAVWFSLLLNLVPDKAVLSKKS